MSAPDFTGDLDGYLEWRRENPQPFNPLWCAEHWSPCPVEGKNGILASARLMHIAINELMPADVVAGDQTAKNSWMYNLLEPICCKIGEARLEALWQGC